MPSPSTFLHRRPAFYDKVKDKDKDKEQQKTKMTKMMKKRVKMKKGQDDKDEMGN